MKLTVVVYDNGPGEPRDGGNVPYAEYVISGCGGDLNDIALGGEQVQDGFMQAEQVARLIELSKIIQENVKSYYARENEFPIIKSHR